MNGPLYLGRAFPTDTKKRGTTRHFRLLPLLFPGTNDIRRRIDRLLLLA